MRAVRTGKRGLTEADITRQIRDLLRAIGVFHWKQWQGPMSQPRGVSDILGIYRGRPLAIEVKRPGGSLSEHQERFLERWRAEGGIGFKACCVEDVVRELNLREADLGPLFDKEPPKKGINQKQKYRPGAHISP